MQDLIKTIEDYIPKGEQEKKDKDIILRACREYSDVLTRQNELMHFTASYFVINKSHDKVLCTYHKIYDTWGWGGGHADGDANLYNVAIKECQEETGLMGLKPLSLNPISIDILPTGSHYKRGKYVPAHLHLNLTYLFEGDESLPLQYAPDENKAVEWKSFSLLCEQAREAFMRDVYIKLIARIVDKQYS